VNALDRQVKRFRKHVLFFLKHILLLILVICKLNCNNLIFNEIMILNASCVCVCMHSLFIENHPIHILEDGLLISEVVLLQYMFLIVTALSGR
jgi:hypothetical protein